MRAGHQVCTLYPLCYIQKQAHAHDAHLRVIARTLQTAVVHLYHVLARAVTLSLNTEASCIKLVTLLPRFSCLLQIELMHDRANCWPRLCVAYIRWNMPGCKCPMVYQHAEAAWALAIQDCKDLARVLTQEWVLSIRADKTSTWALTWSRRLLASSPGPLSQL